MELEYMILQETEPKLLEKDILSRLENSMIYPVLKRFAESRGVTLFMLNILKMKSDFRKIQIYAFGSEGDSVLFDELPLDFNKVSEFELSKVPPYELNRILCSELEIRAQYISEEYLTDNVFDREIIFDTRKIVPKSNDEINYTGHTRRYRNIKEAWDEIIVENIIDHHRVKEVKNAISEFNYTISNLYARGYFKDKLFYEYFHCNFLNLNLLLDSLREL